MTHPTKEQAEAALNELEAVTDGCYQEHEIKTIRSYIAALEAEVGRKELAIERYRKWIEANVAYASGLGPGTFGDAQRFLQEEGK